MEAVADKIFAHAKTAVCFNCAGDVPEDAIARAMARHGFTYADQDFQPREQPFLYGGEDFMIACRMG
jgi:hypothetical protein